MALAPDTEESRITCIRPRNSALEEEICQKQHCSGNRDNGFTQDISQETDASISHDSSGAAVELLLLHRKLPASHTHINSLKTQRIEIKILLAKTLSSKHHKKQQVSQIETSLVMATKEIAQLQIEESLAGGVSEDELETETETTPADEQGNGQTVASVTKGEYEQSKYRLRANNHDARLQLEVTTNRCAEMLYPSHLEPLNCATRRRLNPSSCSSGIALIYGDGSEDDDSFTFSSCNDEWEDEIDIALRNRSACDNPLLDLLSKFT